MPGDSVFLWVCHATINTTGLLPKTKTSLPMLSQALRTRTGILGARLTELTACWSSCAECEKCSQTPGPTMVLRWSFICTSLRRHEQNCRLQLQLGTKQCTRKDGCRTKLGSTSKPRGAVRATVLSIVVQRRHDVIICLTSGLHSDENPTPSTQHKAAGEFKKIPVQHRQGESERL